MLNRVRQPFNVNALAQAAALAALADAAYVEESRALNDAGHAQLDARARKRSACAYVPSHGNFVLANVGDAARVNTALLQQGVIVRPVANYGLPEWLRITVGLPDGEHALPRRRSRKALGAAERLQPRAIASSSSSASA